MEYSQGGSYRRQPDTRRPNTRTGSSSYGSYASERKRRRSMRYVTQYDFALLFLTIGIALFGVLMIYSAGYYTASLRGDPLFYVKSQVKGLFLGFLVMILVSRLDYQVLMHKIGFLHSSLSQISLIFAYILQIMVLFVGVERNGAKRWLDLKVIQFQPSEISKIATILFLAYAIYKNRRALDNKWGIGALRLLVYIGPLIIIIRTFFAFFAFMTLSASCCANFCKLTSKEQYRSFPATGSILFSTAPSISIPLAFVEVRILPSCPANIESYVASNPKIP
jgi:cell division protein FtsW (lipid II flippase)